MATYARDPANVQPTSAVDDLPPPKRTIEECEAILTAPGAMHEWEVKTIEGRTVRVFKNMPPSLRDFWLAMSATWADREYVVLGDERLTYKQVSIGRVFLAHLLTSLIDCRFMRKLACLQIF